MSSTIKSVSTTRELSKNLQELQKEFKNYQSVVKKNTKELVKINDEVESNKLKEIKLLEEQIHKLETQTQWVQNDEPAIKVSNQHMLKKLDIL
ncbi:MAG: hypothetical protein HON90_06470 [Halobacteriovoraceae bacterium]|jgi:hypothetical protein|nr:hypothetical protein [Halobacteriovoraceae bacterium]